MDNKKIGSTLVVLCCILISLQAQNPKFTVEVSNDTLLLGNYFELKYTIENTSGNHFDPPKLEKFHVIGGPNTSTSMSIVNGEMSQSSSYAYYIEPDEIGSYTIPPAYLQVGSSTSVTTLSSFRPIRNFLPAASTRCRPSWSRSRTDTRSGVRAGRSSI